MIYHYTMIPTVRKIQADGVIRSASQILFADAFARQIAHTTPPIVWLTLNPLGEGTTLAKAKAGGYKGKLIGDIGRILVADEIAPMDLNDYTQSINLPLEAWRWVLATAEMIDIDPTVWRVCPRDIPREEWQGVEVLSGIDAVGTTWMPLK